MSPPYPWGETLLFRVFLNPSTRKGRGNDDSSPPNGRDASILCVPRVPWFELPVFRSFLNTSFRTSGSDVATLKQFGDGGIELLAPAHVVETLEQIFRAHPGTLCALEVVKDLAAMHHDDTIAQVNGLLHRMCHH